MKTLPAFRVVLPHTEASGQRLFRRSVRSIKEEGGIPQDPLYPLAHISIKMTIKISENAPNSWGIGARPGDDAEDKMIL